MQRKLFFCRWIDIPVDLHHFVADRFNAIGVCGHDTLICVPFQCFRLAVHCCDGTFPVFLSYFINFHPQCYFSVLFCQPVHFCEPCLASLDLWVRPPCHVQPTHPPDPPPPFPFSALNPRHLASKGRLECGFRLGYKTLWKELWLDCMLCDFDVGVTGRFGTGRFCGPQRASMWSCYWWWCCFFSVFLLLWMLCTVIGERMVYFELIFRSARCVMMRADGCCWVGIQTRILCAEERNALAAP